MYIPTWFNKVECYLMMVLVTGTIPCLIESAPISSALYVLPASAVLSIGDHHGANTQDAAYYALMAHACAQLNSNFQRTLVILEENDLAQCTGDYEQCIALSVYAQEVMLNRLRALAHDEYHGTTNQHPNITFIGADPRGAMDCWLAQMRTELGAAIPIIYQSDKEPNAYTHDELMSLFKQVPLFTVQDALLEIEQQLNSITHSFDLLDVDKSNVMLEYYERIIEFYRNVYAYAAEVGCDTHCSLVEVVVTHLCADNDVLPVYKKLGAWQFRAGWGVITDMSFVLTLFKHATAYDRILFIGGDHHAQAINKALEATGAIHVFDQKSADSDTIMPEAMQPFLDRFCV